MLIAETVNVTATPIRVDSANTNGHVWNATVHNTGATNILVGPTGAILYQLAPGEKYVFDLGVQDRGLYATCGTTGTLGLIGITR